MGGGNYDDDAVAARVSSRVASGKAPVASYTADIRLGVTVAACHADMNPFGVKIRESRDSADHPESNPVVIMLDQTGSMGSVIHQLQTSLKPLMGLLVRKGYLKDPQILIAAVGDAENDEKAPLQVGQFESDDRIEGNLDNIYIEGNGGGQNRETYQYGAYFIARHTVTDAWEKRGKQGYVFIFGDEFNHPYVSKTRVKELIGDTLESDISLNAIYAQLRERWHVFFVLPKHASNGGDKSVIDHWKRLLGNECVLELEDENAAAEAVAVQIGLCEGTTDMGAFAKDIADIHGASTKTDALVRAVSRSVNTTHTGQAITKVPAGTLAVDAAPPAVERL